MKLEKGIPLIDQHDSNGYWGGKFGGNQIAESGYVNLFSLLAFVNIFFSSF